MVKFEAAVGKQVMFPGKVFTFTDTVYETDNQDEIEALEGALNVKKVSGRAKKPKPEE